MATERQDALREFVAVTGAEEDRARFFLESAGWDLQVAARGRVRWAGRGAAGRGRLAHQAGGGRSAQSSRRAAARPRPRGPGAACHASPARPGRGKRRASPGPVLRALAPPSASPAGGVSETSGAAATRVEKGAGGVAASPRLG